MFNGVTRAVADGGGDNISQSNFYCSYAIEVEGKWQVHRVLDLKVKTTNEAEYEALIHLLKYLKENNYDNVVINSDSKLVVSQINGEFRVRKLTLVPFYLRALGLIASFKDVRLEWVSRNEIVPILGH
jgi:ribonuclease HI